MPRYAHAQLRWSEHDQTYVLFIGEQASEQALTSEWLEQNASFAFHSRSGIHYTVRKQRVQRGSSYWYAYRRLRERIVKRYLGKTADLTYARLEEIARLLEGMSDAHQPALEEPGQAPASFQPAPIEASPLLLSKLSPPGLHASLLDRSRLLALLDAGCEVPLTLLSAPAGFGKTTLVSQWLATRHASLPFGWVSLETSDNDLLRFWRYLIAACQAFQVDLQEVYSILASLAPQPPFLPSSLEAMLTTLLNALAQLPTQGILVLEDYHVITSPLIHETLSFFLEHLPATLHLIMITRSDPPFSLARLRARNALYEIRATDLRFSQEESALLLQRTLSFSLETSTIQRLHAQLEGWGAGLHLVKLALQRTSTPAESEQALAHLPLGNASLQEYFVSEVLALQAEPVQQFLLQTSILTRLAASLCDAVTAQDNSQDMLMQLEHLDLFLEPLHNEGQWYRYHALFAEAMRHEARRRLGEEQLRYLSARASHWYETHGYPGEAIDAALDAQDYNRASSLIERSIERQTFPGEIQEPHTLYRWLEQLPDAHLEQQPVLCLSYATTLLFRSPSWLPDTATQLSIEKLLLRAEQGFHVANQQAKLGELYAFRALLALRQGDMPAATHYAKQALDWLPQLQGKPPIMQGTYSIWRGLSLSIVAEEWIEAGYFPKARTALLESQALCAAAENHYFQRVAMLKLAQVFFEQGENQQATSLYRQVLASAREGGPIYTLCNALYGLASLCYEHNELESASHYAQEAITASQSQPLVYHEVRATLILARVQQAQGQAVVAQQQLAALLDKIPLSLPLLLQEVQTAQARLALSAGDQITIHRWATGRKPQHNFSQAIEEDLLVARWLRSQGKLEEASHQLKNLLLATQEAQHTRRMLEVLVEMVLVAAASKRKTEALHLLLEVLVQAFAGNAQRLFLDAGEQMAILLRSLLPHVHEQSLLAYMRALLSAFPAQQQDGTQTLASSLVEPLSPQEKRVLRLLVQQRSNADIANELVVSVNTVRTQVQSIYAKLGVHTRHAASEVARELHLV
ncbi:HTH-type transcriptional regulator MalT [Ktedonobacter sp. SOSP1-85]|uniref:LuxR C-terminal-related transcriptional regulator n=1 Tax=Ktedonobacter sp. SOSP1-85 TaxID=2778367 RepID=UPI0019162B22|nr:LuxR C-terminal-related transcriptional regulator [Ktedonobacter sp. SOSP1-85]GHO80554.1 HTH-type transcriptional regulator MalT [Ktedonobacter sp. SOSP1-85]